MRTSRITIITTGLFLLGIFFLFPPTVVKSAACTQDQFIPLAYPNDLKVAKNKKTNEVAVQYISNVIIGKYYPNDQRPPKAPPNQGLIWIPKEACSLDKVNLLIAMHGHRSLKYANDPSNANPFLQSSAQKHIETIIREQLDKKKIVPIIIAAPMDDQGPNETVWDHPADYNINTHIKKIKEALQSKGITTDFSQVSIMGHSNANCGGGLARSAQELSGYKLYLYGAADGTCGKLNEQKEGYGPFFKLSNYNVFNIVNSKGAILFHLHQHYADTDAVTEIKQQYAGTLDPDATDKNLYSEMWRSNDGKVFSYALTPGGDHDHTNVPQYLLKEILPRFFSASAPYDPTKHPVPAGKSSKNPNYNPATGASAWTAAKNIPLTNEELQKFLQKPTPRIKIPGLNFSDITVENLKSEGQDGVSYLGIPHLGEYVAALYKYLVVIAGIVSTVRLMIAGLQWALPDVSGERRSNAKKIMVSSVSGLVIAVTSYTILFTINPELVQFRNLHVLFIQPEGDGSAEHTAEKAATSGVKPSPCTGKKLPSQGIIGVADFARSEPYSCGNRDLSSVKYVVIHEGAVGDTTGVLTARGLSTHFVVQRDGKISQNVDIRRRAAHAGSIANPWSVGIDLQIPKGCNQSGKCVNDKECSAICSYTPEQYESLNQIINILTQKTGIRKNDEHIIAHCQILYGNPSAGHGDPRNFDWKKIGLDPDQHRKNNNYINGRCIKTYTVDTFDTLNQKSPKPKAVGAAGCCQIIENEQTKFINVPNNQCIAMKNSINWSEESCV